MDLLHCPMCSFSVPHSEAYVLQLHFEQEHTTDSPFKIKDDGKPLPPLPPATSSASRMPTDREEVPSNNSNDDTVECSFPDCGEVVLLHEFNDHLDLHSAATLSFDEATGKYSSQSTVNMQSPMANPRPGSLSFVEEHFDSALPDALRRKEDGARKLKKRARGRNDSSASERSSLSRSILSFNPFYNGNKLVKPPASTLRLGKRELGPYAWEDRMPQWLHDQLAAGAKITVLNRIGRDGRLIKQEVVQNETPGIIPILAQLSALDRSVQEAYYCHPATVHIGKTPKEGGFCGYRNIQMLLSYVQGARAQGHEEFPGRTPGVLRLQDLIERAWDKDINSIGRQQTGGIRNTRKYIGTPEAQALFLSSEIDCAVELFTDTPDGQTKAHEVLLAAVERYFAQAAVDDGSNVRKTLLPPIYLQYEGHSLTIVGFERQKNRSCNLIVFDPMYHTSPAMHRLVGRKNIKTYRPEVLYSYRRGLKALGKYCAFEILMLTAHPPLFPAWDILRQFPDCRYLYAFFRSRTLGYDVYPEDHFLRNFPWQQYGGLWIVDEGRFARSDRMNPLAAQALLRLTSEGSSSSCSGAAFSRPDGTLSSHFPSSTSDSSNHVFPNLYVLESAESTRHASNMSAYGSTQRRLSLNVAIDPMSNILGMVGMHNPQPPPAPTRDVPSLSVHTDMKKRFPGYPSPNSPTTDAKIWFPSPVPEFRTNKAILTPTPSARTPMSIDGSDMCGPSFRYNSRNYERYVSNVSSYGSRFKETRAGMNSSPKYQEPLQQGLSRKRSMSSASIRTTSPTRAVSPRTLSLESIAGKQAFQSFVNNPTFFGQHMQQQLWLNQFSDSLMQTLARIGADDMAYRNRPSSPKSLSPPSVPIANGTEANMNSPLSPSGTMLSYISNRAVDSGLLALSPLSEAQVAEYRFWRPCGRRSCAFGCGGASEGEAAAAKKLFRGEEIVKEETEVEDDDMRVSDKARMTDGRVSEARCRNV